MLPFIAAMGVFLYKWASSQSEQHYMWYAVASLAAGIIFAAAVAGTGSQTAETTATGSAGSSGSNEGS